MAIKRRVFGKLVRFFSTFLVVFGGLLRCSKLPPFHSRNVGAHAKKTTDTLTMTSSKRHIVLQTDYTTGLTRLDQHCNRTRTIMSDKKEKRKSPRFAFLKISANAHLAHPAFPSHKAYTQKREEPNFFQRCKQENSKIIIILKNITRIMKSAL